MFAEKDENQVGRGSTGRAAQRGASEGTCKAWRVTGLRAEKTAAWAGLMIMGGSLRTPEFRGASATAAGGGRARLGSEGTAAQRGLALCYLLGPL